MINIRKSNERGRTEIGWLDSRHTFSFGRYRDPRHMGFRRLRVINDDRIAPGEGFATHGHQDMEIITVVTEGTLEHKDSLGSTSIIRPGDVQVMSAGSGIKHSEFNASDKEPLHLWQIWILPERIGDEPTYEERRFPEDEYRGQLRLIASRDGKDDSLKIGQDVSLLRGTIESGEGITYILEPGRHIWLQVLQGRLSIIGTPLEAGDGAAVSDESQIKLTTDKESSVLLFDLG